MGWAWDPAHPNAPVQLELLDGEQRLTSITADLYRQSFEQAGLGNGKHGFQLEPPFKVKDGKPHLLHVRFAKAKIELKGSPKELIATTFDGALRNASSNGISGWAWDEAAPEKRLDVELLEGEALIAVVRADLDREFLKDAGKGDGKYGFHLPLPASLKDGKPHAITARIAQNQQELTGSPKTVLVPSREGRLGGITNSWIFGWAWDANSPETAAEVEFLADGVPIGRAKADGYRENLKRAGIGDGKHGFVFQLPHQLRDGKPHSVRARIAGTNLTDLANPLNVTLPTRIATESIAPGDQIKPKEAANSK
jgi:hypothetical protein